MERLLEREVELEALMAASERARSGRGAIALLRGEAGIGKTSLLRELKERAGGCRSNVGHCELLSVPEPLGPVRELAEGVGAGDMPELDGPDRRALARALQLALARGGPVVAAVEDAHWADPATLDVVRLLARRAEDAPLAIVVTFREDELSANVELAELVGDLATDAGVTQIAPRPLSLDAVRSIAAGHDADAAELARVTGGNPFLVVEAVAAGKKVPRSVRDATLARVSRLSAEARGLVDAAAVVGRRVLPALLEELVPGCDAALEVALARGVLSDDGVTLGFRHELTRQAIEGALSTPRRAGAAQARGRGARRPAGPRSRTDCASCRTLRGSRLARRREHLELPACGARSRREREPAPGGRWRSGEAKASRCGRHGDGKAVLRRLRSGRILRRPERCERAGRPYLAARGRLGAWRR
jgi:AAA ATPase domain